MPETLTSHPATARVLLAAAHHGVRAPFWIFGWIVIIALIGAVVYFIRRRRRPSEPGNPTYRQPQEHRHDS